MNSNYGKLMKLALVTFLFCCTGLVNIQAQEVIDKVVKASSNKSEEADKLRAEAFVKMNRKLDEIKISRFAVIDTDVEDAIDLLMKVSKKNDTLYNEGVNIVFYQQPSSEEAKEEQAEDDYEELESSSKKIAEKDRHTVSMSLQHLRLRQVLKYVCQASELKWRVLADKIIVGKKLPLAPLETRMFAVRKSFIRSVIESNDGWDDDEEGSWGDEDDEGEELIVSSEDIKAFFKKLGVEFPPTTLIEYLPGIGKLTVTHEPSELSKIQRLIFELDKGRPSVAITAKFVELKDAEVVEILMDANKKGMDDEAKGKAGEK